MTESLGAGANGLGSNHTRSHVNLGKLLNLSVLSSLFRDTEMLIWPAY